MRFVLVAEGIYVYSCVLATWVGGGTVVGLCEIIYTPSEGLMGAMAFLTAYASSFIIGKTITIIITVQWSEIFN